MPTITTPSVAGAGMYYMYIREKIFKLDWHLSYSLLTHLSNCVYKTTVLLLFLYFMTVVYMILYLHVNCVIFFMIVVCSFFIFCWYAEEEFLSFIEFIDCVKYTYTYFHRLESF